MNEMLFDVHDEACLRIAFNAESSLEGEGDTWSWVADGIMLGTMELTSSQLRFTENPIGGVRVWQASSNASTA